MTEEQKNKLQKIEGLTRVLLENHSQLKEELSELRNELLKVNEDLDECHGEIARLQLENASLKSATAVSYTKDEAIAEKERLKNLVRKIDKCISLLK